MDVIDRAAWRSYFKTVSAARQKPELAPMAIDNLRIIASLNRGFVARTCRAAADELYDELGTR